MRDNRWHRRPTRFGPSALFLVAVAFCGGPAGAQVQLDRLYPPAVAIGSEATLKAEGKFASWPVTILCDRSDVKVVAGEESGELKVNVPADASPGVVWVRLHDKVSASKLVPLLIEPLVPVDEAEPNQRIEEAASLKLPAIVSGRLAKRGDVDTFSVSLRAGQTLVAHAEAHRLLRSPMDAVLQVVDVDGNVLVQSDDVRGLDPIVTYTAEEDRRVILRLFAFPETPNSTIGYAGAASFVYLLRITTDAILDHVAPLVVSPDDAVPAMPRGWNLPDSAVVDVGDITMRRRTAHSPGALGWQWQIVGPASSIGIHETDESSAPKAAHLPCVFSGRLHSTEIDRIRFDVRKGVRYRAAVQSRRFGIPLDSVLKVIDVSSGDQLAVNDDRARREYDAAVEFTAKADAEVELQVSDLVGGSGPLHAYSVVIEEATPSVELVIDADHYHVKPGDSLEITVTVSRNSGFNRKLQIAVDELPSGIECEPVVSETKGGSAKSVKLKLTADKEADFQGKIRIVGHAMNDKDELTEERFVAVHPLRELVDIEDIWLTAAAKDK